MKVTGASGGTISIDTGSGEVNGTDIKATALDVDTGSGDVELSDVIVGGRHDRHRQRIGEPGPQDGGRSPQGGYGSGSVTIAVPGTLSAQVAIETGSGDISTDFPIQVQDRRG